MSIQSSVVCKFYDRCVFTLTSTAFNVQTKQKRRMHCPLWGTCIRTPCGKLNISTNPNKLRSVGQVVYYPYASKCSLYTFYNNPAPLNGSTQFYYCTDSNPGTGADDAFVLKRGVWRNATWPSHSRPAIAASARHFQICFLP